MQIPSINLAASLAGVTSKSAADKPSESPGVEVVQQAHVEQSTDANPDRDAQGQGDGLGDRHQPRRPVPPSANEAPPEHSPPPAPALPDEPPSELDIIG